MNDMNFKINDEMILSYGSLNFHLKLIDTITYDKIITWKVPRVIKGEGYLPEPVFDFSEQIINLLGNGSFKRENKSKEFILTKSNSKIRNLYSLFIEIYTDRDVRE